MESQNRADEKNDDGKMQCKWGKILSWKIIGKTESAKKLWIGRCRRKNTENFVVVFEKFRITQEKFCRKGEGFWKKLKQNFVRLEGF